MAQRLKQIENRIAGIKRELAELGPMRPGSLTRQYKNPEEKTGGYYQISYTHQMKSRTEYVRPQFVPEIRRQIAAFKKFRKLTQTWVNLGIEYSRLKMKDPQ